MPTVQISPRPDGVQIQVRDIANAQAELLSALQECKEGRCSCPTPEYDKVASMDVATTGDSVQVELRTKPGATMAIDAVQTCLDCTLARIAQKDSAP